VDGTRFDQLITHMATQRVSRLAALRGLAVGAVASVTGLRLLGEEALAKHNHEKKIRICHRSSATDPGVSKKLKKDKAKKHLKRHPFDIKGRCSAAAPAGLQCTNNNDCTGGLVCIGQRCVSCTADVQCSGGLVCLGGACQTRPPGPPPECMTNNQCSGGRVCVGGACVNCDFEANVNQCGGGQICAENGQCSGGQACDPTMTPDDQCPEPLECQPKENGDFACLLEIFQGFDLCPPVFDLGRPCPTTPLPFQSGIQTVCFLGQCLVPCDEDADCTGIFGRCRSGFCLRQQPD
jgi:hypothetical protein